jgi:hypothetical protein
MSVNIATMGMFKDCCGGGFVGGGGAPPYRPNASETVKPLVLVKKFEMKTKNNIEDYLKKIKVKLIDME